VGFGSLGGPAQPGLVQGLFMVLAGGLVVEAFWASADWGATSHALATAKENIVARMIVFEVFMALPFKARANP
jgi:hypothetical protein